MNPILHLTQIEPTKETSPVMIVEPISRVQPRLWRNVDTAPTPYSRVLLVSGVEIDVTESSEEIAAQLKAGVV